jgi:hypothetical protein
MSGRDRNKNPPTFKKLHKTEENETKFTTVKVKFYIWLLENNSKTFFCYHQNLQQEIEKFRKFITS